jgi:hypothetical protein
MVGRGSSSGRSGGATITRKSAVRLRLPQKGIRLDADGAERGDHASAESTLTPLGTEAVGIVRPILDPPVRTNSCSKAVMRWRPLAASSAAPRSNSPGAFPGAPVGVADVAEKEMFRS